MIKEKVREVSEEFKGFDNDYMKDAYARAKSEKVTLSYKLETDYPSTKDDLDKGRDAFVRILKDSGIRTKSNHTMGVYASKVDDFYRSSYPASQFLFPEWLNRTLRQSIQETDILDALVSITTAINTNVYKTIHLENTDNTKKSTQKKRVAEGAKFPTVKLTTSEHAINLYKYGAKILMSYENARRMSVDLVNVHMQRIASQSALDQASDAINVLINGDGNGNPAAVHNLTDLDAAAAAGTLTYVGLMNYVMQFFPYNVDTMIGNTATILKIITLTMPNTVLNTTNQLKIPNFRDAQGRATKSINLYVHNDMDDDDVLGFDSRYAAEKVVEQGADLVETDKIIDGQWDVIVFSEMVGFGKLDVEAALMLEINA